MTPPTFAQRLDDALALRGDEPAVVALDGTLTGSQLLSRSSALAATLRGHRIVSLLATRTSETVVAMLACLKAGVPYLPLEPMAAPEYLARRVRSVRSGLLLSGASTLRDASVIAELAGIEARSTSDLGEHRSPVGLSPTGRAYVLATSGTTGEPRNVVVPVSALAGYVDAVVPRLGGAAALHGRRMAVVSTLAADLGYTMVYPALLCGGELHVLPEALAHDPLAFADYAHTHRLDAVKLTPTLLTALLANTPGTAALPREILVVGGERFTPALRDELRRRDPACRVFNHYGPTETCVGVATHELDLTADTADVPVGRPFDGTGVAVVGQDLTPVPDGTPGELVIGGVQVAEGYLDDPAATATRFVASRFVAGRAGGGRVYRTGDRAVLTTGGELVILGRLDRQAKIRGHRFEPAGIEACLRCLPGITDAHVAVRAVGDLGEVVLAWVLAGDTASETVSEAGLRAALASRLPAALIPARVLVLREFPRTVNGKLDTGRLPVPSTSVTRATGTLTERVAQTLAAVLGLDTVDPDADIFGAGMHSLAVLTAVARIERDLSMRVRVRDFHRARTARGIAGLCVPVTPAPVAHGRESGLTPHQLALWIEQERAPEDTTYLVPVRLLIEGLITADALTAALATVIARHPALHTRIVAGDGAPTPLPDAALRVSCQVTDVSGPDGERMAARCRGELFAKPLDLTAGPPLRAALLRWADDRHELVLAAHHVLFDLASVAILARDLLDVLTGEGAGDRAEWLPRTVPPAGPPDRALPAAARFGLDEPVGHRQVGRVQRTIPAGTWSGVRALAERTGVSDFAASLAAWALVLRAQEGEQSFVVATPVDLRSDYQAEAAVGCFVNTVPVVLELGTCGTVCEVLEYTHAAVADALDDRVRPLAEHVGRARRDHGRRHVVRTMLTVERAQAWQAGSLRVTRQPDDTARAVTDLDLVITELAAGAPVAALAVDLRTCSRERAEALLDQFLRALDVLATDGLARLDEISLLSARFRAQVLSWSRAPLDVDEPSISDRIRDRVSRSPDRTALRWTTGAWTYAELTEVAAGYRARLTDQGVRPGGLVGLGLPVCPELVALWLATVQLGGTVLALDPAWPRTRWESAAGGLAPDVVVTDRTLPSAAERVRGAALAVVTPPAASAAYVILTSGSTGTPRGVAVSYGALGNHLAWMQHTFPLDEHDRVLVQTSPGFDVAVWEILAPLGAGATAVLAVEDPDQPVRDVAALAGLIAAERVTVMQTVPALLGALSAEPAFVGAPDLRLVFCGGEEMPAGLAGRFRRGFPRTRLFNMYGPTETTIDATWYEVTGDCAQRVPIGHPVGNATIYVLDQRGQLVPPGVVGELAIGGAGVAHGYVGDPAATADRFRADPYADRPGARLFRTGDRTRWRSAGVVEFLGRTDNQVKVRGHRMELEEIEAALTTVPGVREAAVLLGDDGHLAAYLVTGSEPAESAIRAWLAARLPAAMLPARFSLVPAIPRLPNGKVDRAAVARTAGRALRTGGRALTAAETRVAAIWGELLGAVMTDADRGFFDAGGNSLLVLRLRTRLAEEFAVGVTVAHLFEHTTVSAQARWLSGTATPGPTRTGGGRRAGLARLGGRRTRS